MIEIESREILRIGPLATRYGVSTESLRVWERRGLIPPSHRTPGGHRRYGEEHLRALDQLLGPQSGASSSRWAASSAR